MKRIGRVPAPSVERSPRRGAVPARQDHDAASELLALQQRVGNRAFTQGIAQPSVQRHEGPTSNEEVGDRAGSVPGAAGPAEASPASATATGVEPGTGTTGPAATGLTGEVRKKAIEDTLRASATGMWAMGILSKWTIPVDYEFGGKGSFHQGGKIFINKSLGVGAAAIVMMHEAQHADTFKSGKGADLTKLSRADYVKQKIADEAEAVVRQIEGLAVTTSLGVDMTGNPITPGLKERYLKAFYLKRDELKAANPAMTTAQINAACRLSTRDGEVTNWFHDGTFVTSTDDNSYAVFYGKQWDDENKAPGS